MQKKKIWFLSIECIYLNLCTMCTDRDYIELAMITSTSKLSANSTLQQFKTLLIN